MYSRHSFHTCGEFHRNYFEIFGIHSKSYLKQAVNSSKKTKIPKATSKLKSQQNSPPDYTKCEGSISNTEWKKYYITTLLINYL